MHDRSGTQVGRLRLAIQRLRTRDGEDRGADYVDVTVFNTQAEVCRQCLSKRRRVAIEGRRHSEWQAEDGSHRHPGVRQTGGRASEHQRLWAMTRDERVAAMWKSQLTLQELAHWSSHAPHEVPLLGGEFAWTAMRTPERAEAARQHERSA